MADIIRGRDMGKNKPPLQRPTGVSIGTAAISTSLGHAISEADPAREGFLVRLLTQLGTFMSASALVALVGKVFDASDFQVSVLGASILLLLYALVYRRKIDRVVSSSLLLSGMIIVGSALLFEKSSLLNSFEAKGLAKTTGIIEYVPHANDWLPTQGKYIDGAHEEIWLVGISFYVTLPQYKDELIKKLHHGVDVRFLVYNPLSPNVSEVASEFGQTTEEFVSESEVTIHNLRAIRDAWAKPTSSAKFEVRLFTKVPTERIYMFDRRSEGGYTFFIPHVDNKNSPNLPGFLIRNIRTGIGPAYFEGAERVWNTALPFDEFLKQYDAARGK